MAHQIIIGKIGAMQGANVTGEGSLERLKCAATTIGAYEDEQVQSPGMFDAIQYLGETVLSGISGSFSVEDVEMWVDECESLIGAA